MWLEHIHTLIEETNMNDLNCDLPLAIFIIKLLSAKINLSGIENKQKYLDYIESEKPIKLRYFIQSTIKEEIEKECVIKEKELEDDLKELDEMFSVENDAPRSKILQTPSYENRMILYENYIEDEYMKQDIMNYWIQKEVNFDRNRIKCPSPPWGLVNYYNYFKTSIQNRDRYMCANSGISTYRYRQKQILNILNRFSVKEPFMKLLESIHDVKVSKLMDDRDKDSLNY